MKNATNEQTREGPKKTVAGKTPQEIVPEGSHGRDALQNTQVSKLISVHVFETSSLTLTK